MKLMMCPKCGDVLQLRHTDRSCECGFVHGHYLPDNINAKVSKEAISLAIGNGSLALAIHQAKMLEKNTAGLAKRDDYIRQAQVAYTWVRPNEGEGNPHTTVIEESTDSKGEA